MENKGKEKQRKKKIYIGSWIHNTDKEAKPLTEKVFRKWARDLMKVTKGEHGETRELKLGEVEIVSHVYYRYQRLHLKMEGCSLVINPRGVDIDGDESTGVSITVEKGYPIVKYEGKWLWFKVYQKRKTKGTYAGRDWEVLEVIMVCPKCHKLMRQTQWLETTDPETKEVETTYWWTCFNCKHWKTEVVKGGSPSSERRI